MCTPVDPRLLRRLGHFEEAGEIPPTSAPSDKTALDVQVGGDHYRKGAIQPVEFSYSNGFGFCEGSIIKYVARHRRKGGKQDLLKARHYIDLLIQLEYPEEKP